MNIGERIRTLREKNEMTQTELAQKIGSTKQTIYKYENGVVTNIPYDKLILLAKALKTTPAALMGWKDEEKNNSSDLTARDERDIKQDLANIIRKLTTGEAGPATYDGENLDPEAAELFKDDLEIALRRLKLINKEKYNPNKNKE